MDGNIYSFNRKKTGNTQTVQREIKVEEVVQVDQEKVRQQE